MRLYLVRHGQSESNVRGALDTAPPGAPLTELGLQQAQQLAEVLDGEPISAVYSSRATRARQTAGAVAARRELETQVIDGVHEVSAGDLEGRTDRASIETYLGVIGPWARGDLSVRMPGAETGNEVRRRFLDAVNEISAKYGGPDSEGVVMLVCHGALLRLGGEWLADNVTPDIAERELLPNTAVLDMRPRADGSWRCATWAGLTL